MFLVVNINQHLLLIRSVVGVCCMENWMNSHEYTWETLFHFSCGECSNWWSYAGILENNELRALTMTCPHCGYKTKIELKEGFKEVNG